MPRAGDAFLNGLLPTENDPTKRINSQASKPAFDPLAMIEQFTQMIEDYIFPIVKDLTGIDLSSPEAFFTSLAAILVGGGTAALAFIQSIVQAVVDAIFGGITGSSATGNPLAVLQPLFSGLAGAAATAINSANQATDLARQLASYVVQTVQGLTDVPVFTDLLDMVNQFAFWFLGMFGITQQSVSDANPAVAAANGRIAALESINTVGLEGMADHFNRPAIGSDWTSITSFPDLTIKDSAYLKSDTVAAGRYTAKTLLTDNWHVQFTCVDIDFGSGLIYVSCPPSTTNAGFNNGVAVEFEHFFYGDVFRLYTMSGGLTTGVTLRTQVQLDTGNFKVGDVLAVEYLVDDNKFYVFHNTNEITALQWEDTGNAVSHGSGHREIAVLQNKTNDINFRGPGFDDFSAYDIKVT